MFTVTEAEAAAIRTAFDRGAEFSAALELRRLFPAITGNVQARECARTIAGWKPLPLRAVKRAQRVTAGTLMPQTDGQRRHSPGRPGGLQSPGATASLTRSTGTPPKNHA